MYILFAPFTSLYFMFDDNFENVCSLYTVIVLLVFCVFIPKGDFQTCNLCICVTVFYFFVLTRRLEYDFPHFFIKFYSQIEFCETRELSVYISIIFLLMYKIRKHAFAFKRVSLSLLDSLFLFHNLLSFVCDEIDVLFRIVNVLQCKHRSLYLSAHVCLQYSLQ